MAESRWQRKAHVGEDRRSDCRSIDIGATVIDVLNPQPRSSVQANIVDVGTSGLKLSVPFFLVPGSLIRIHMTDAVANAEVRYCNCEGSQYHAGVRVDEIIPKDN
jgi:hypothetical protein